MCDLFANQATSGTLSFDVFLCFVSTIQKPKHFMIDDASVQEDFVRNDGSFGLKFGDSLDAKQLMRSRQWFEWQTIPYTVVIKPFQCGACSKLFISGKL